MSILRVARIACDRCHLAAELTPTTNAGRSVKPVGWARLSMSAKTALDQPVEVVKTVDLCPKCQRMVIDFIDRAETVKADT